MGKQLGFFIDTSLCSGCSACQVACKDKNDIQDDRAFRRILKVETGGFVPSGDAYVNNVAAYTMSISCNHCSDPVCVRNCPTTAMTKREEDGVVFVDLKKCIGCGLCAWSCPYGAPQMNTATGQMSKCDFCIDLQAQGEDPACVAACPLRAIDYGPIDELREKYGSLADIRGLPDSSQTKPNLVVRPNAGAAVEGI